MFKSFICSTLLGLAALVETGNAQWIDFDSMIRDAVAKQNGAVRAAEANGENIVRANMNDPRIQQMFREYQAQGGPMNFQQFCYSYAATAGGTNVAGYIANENDIANKDRVAAKAYHDHVNKVWGETIDYRNEVNDRIAAGRGDNLTGRTNYYNPHTGGNEYLPYNVPAGTVQTGYYGDPRVMNPNGTYTYGAPNGWNYEMQPAWGR